MATISTQNGVAVEGTPSDITSNMEIFHLFEALAEDVTIS
jgi:hypothetical protein